MALPDEVAVNSLPEWVEWVSALGPAVTILAAGVAASIAFASLVQRRRADAKSEWWRRTQWALEQVLSDGDDRQLVGMSVLLLQSRSELAHVEDLDLFQAAWHALLEDVPQEDDYVVSEDGDDSGPDDEAFPGDHR